MQNKTYFMTGINWLNEKPFVIAQDKISSSFTSSGEILFSDCALCRLRCAPLYCCMTFISVFKCESYLGMCAAL